jgi:hypothetical protein
VLTLFTHSQVLLVDVYDCLLMDVEPIVLKIYDPHFREERKREKLPWSLEKEIGAAEWRAVLGDSLGKDNADMDWQDGPVFSEESQHRLARWYFKKEWRAYERLRALQGTGIGLARCWASGTLLAPSPDTGVSRSIKLPILLLEYVKGTSLYHVDPKLMSLLLSVPKPLPSARRYRSCRSPLC